MLLQLVPRELIQSWRCEADGSYELRFIDNVYGRIRTVGADGVPLAKGARLSFAERVTGRLSAHTITFDANCVKGSKGPISVGVDSIATDETHFHAKGGKVRHNKAMATIADIVWT